MFSIVKQCSIKDRIKVEELKKDMNEKQMDEVCEKIISGNLPSTTGKFGTGFMTTYMLSKNIEISGDLKFPNDIIKQFNLKLDRSPEDPEDLIEILDSDMQQLQKFDSPT